MQSCLHSSNTIMTALASGEYEKEVLMNALAHILECNNAFHTGQACKQWKRIITNEIGDSPQEIYEKVFITVNQ